MANPKKHHSAHRRDKRRAQWKKLPTRSTGLCANCKAPILPHRACPSCGFYKGRPELTITPTKTKGQPEEK